jgi:hypothetical protein
LQIEHAVGYELHVLARRMTALLSALGLCAWLGFVQVPGTDAVAAGPGASSWMLVNSSCTTGQVAVGRACYDPAGASDPSLWQVNEGSATWTEPDLKAEYTYAIPDVIHESGAQLSLETTATDITAGSGVETQTCITSPFPTIPATDPCARAFAQTPGSSANGNKTITLMPSGTGATSVCPGSGPAATPECVTLVVGLGNGGHIYFTYRSMAAQRVKVAYTINSSLELTHPPFEDVKFDGSGSFSIDLTASGPHGRHPGYSQTGSATMTLMEDRGARNWRISLVATQAAYFPARHEVAISYRVTRSTLNCLPVRRQLSIHANAGHNYDEFDFGPFCGKRSSDVALEHTTVVITTG